MIESEKTLEKKLTKEVKNLDGLAIKILSIFYTGLPDRLILISGRAYFVELKTTGKRLRPSQVLVHKKLKKLGFPVTVVDSTEAINNFIKNIIL
jgi:hypothetical protein